MQERRLERIAGGSRHRPSGAGEERQCPRRQAYERLPKWRWLQSLITFVMGVPHDGQTPLLKQTRSLRLAAVFGVFLVAVAAAAAIASLFPSVGWAGRLALLPLFAATLLTASGMFRSMSMYVLHYASHGAYGRYSSLIGHAASTLAFALSLEEYTEKHIRKHHGKLGEKDDPDQQAIIALGFVPGMLYEHYRKHLSRVLLSPRYFWLHLRGRGASQFAAARQFRLKAVVTAFQAVPLVVSLYASYRYGSWAPVLFWALAWLLPLTYGTYASMVLFSLGLHRWFLRREPGMGKWDFYLAKTGARFFGDPAPPKGLSAAEWYRAWGRWWLRFFLLHLLLGKLFIMGLSDNQQHDAHHLDPRSREFLWWASTYSRHRLATFGRDADKMSHTWGSPFAAIRANFERMARTPSLVRDEAESGKKRDNDFLNGM